MWDSASWELNYDSELFTSFSSYVNIVALFIIVFKMTWNTRRCGFRFINGWRLIYSWPWFVRNWYLLSLSFCYDFEHVLSFRGSQEKAYLPTNYDTFGFISGPNVFSKLVQCLLSSFQTIFPIWLYNLCRVCALFEWRRMSPMGVKTCRNSCPSFLILLAVLSAILLCISRRTFGAGLKEGCTPNEGRKLVLPVINTLEWRLCLEWCDGVQSPCPCGRLPPKTPEPITLRRCVWEQNASVPQPLVSEPMGSGSCSGAAFETGCLEFHSESLPQTALSADGLWDFFSQCQYTQTFSQKESGSVTSRHFFIVPYLS